jgi:hypothetical protein
VCTVDSVGSGEGPVAGPCKYGDEPATSGATELVIVSGLATETLNKIAWEKFRYFLNVLPSQLVTNQQIIC